ncbi:MAG: TIGR04086 family membrane protein [Clostridia bacterium]|nr:TIGR04086 family membrane protein [Clostridia bacterium]
MQAEGKGGFIFSVLVGVGIATITALIGVLIFAAVIKMAMLDGAVIKTVSQFLKVLAVFLGCMLSLSGNKGLIKGAVTGVLAMAVIYLLLKLIGGGVSFGLSFLVDLIFGAVVGAISGIIAVNVKGN